MGAWSENRAGEDMSRRQGSNLDFMRKKKIFCRSWHKFQVELQHKILARMRALGMMPVRKTTVWKCRSRCSSMQVLAGFAGQVPDAYVR